MDLFTITAEILVSSLIGATFIAMGASSVLDFLADQRVLGARINVATRAPRNTVAH